MRVLHLATTYPLHAGDSNAVFIEAIAEGLAARGHTIEVVVPWHPELVLDRPASPVRLHAFRYSPTRRWHPWGYAGALRGDRKLTLAAYAAALPAALSSCRRVAELRSGFDLLHAHWLLPNAPIVAAARGGKPMVVSCHGSGVFLAERFGWAAEMARYALRNSRAVTGCSGDIVSRLETLGAGPAPRRQPYGVHTDRFRPLPEEERASVRRELASRLGLDASGRWILAVGRLVYKKGFDTLIRALPALRTGAPDARAVIVGEGPLRDELSGLASELGCDDMLTLAGAVAHADLPALTAAADLIAVPSVHGPAGNVDGLPNTLLEGLSSGTPVIASRVAGIPDVVRHEDNGLLFDEADADELGRGMTRILTEPGLGTRLGERARRDAVANLGWERVALSFEQLYEQALAAPPD